MELQRNGRKEGREGGREKERKKRDGNKKVPLASMSSLKKHLCMPLNQENGSSFREDTAQVLHSIIDRKPSLKSSLGPFSFPWRFKFMQVQNKCPSSFPWVLWQPRFISTFCPAVGSSEVWVPHCDSPAANWSEQNFLSFYMQGQLLP